jgi:hypothetical protein
MSEQREKCDRRNREHWKAEFENADALATAIETFLTTVRIPVGDALGIVRASMVMRMSYALEAVSLLAGRGYFTEATAQLRSLMEAAVKLTALIAEPDLLKEYTMQDELNRKRIFNHILELRSGWAQRCRAIRPMRN